ncbi:MAG: hypothetical protein K2K84_04835 [Muribaculaceae bacterium]|nr:hypothetical protein [Muribaculaceae bacterium]
MKNLKIYAATAAVIAAGMIMDSCTGKEQPITWENVAGTIPSSVSYVMSVNTGLVRDSVLGDIWDGSDVGRLIREALAWPGENPDHLVLLSVGDADVVTWPLTDPSSVSDIVSDWDAASLNGTVDARIRQTSTASVVVSATQAWVVASPNGGDRVNDLLSGAMSSPASQNAALRSVITDVPSAIAGVVAFNNRFYKLGLEQRGDSAMAVVVTAEHADEKAAAIIDDLKPIPASRLTPTYESTPFFDIQLKSGDLPKVLNRLCSVLPAGKLNVGLSMLARMTDPVTGTLTVRLHDRDKSDKESSPRLEVSVPFHTRDSAAKMMASLKTIADKFAPGVADFVQDGTRLVISVDADPAVTDHLTAGRPLALDPSVPSPSVVAHAGLELDGDHFDLTMAANLSRATLVVGFDDNAAGRDRAVALIGKILNKVFETN